jgi:glutaredoxin
MYYLFVVILENCPYSMYAINLLDTLKIKYKYLIVKINEKEKYKTEEINTFPQIYLKKEITNDSLLLGGFNDLEYFIKTFINQKYNKKNILIFKNKYKYWHKKPILRLLEIINQK